MRVSIILFGQPRFVEECFPQIQEKILNNYDCDVYCHMWWNDNIKKNGYTGKRGRFNVKENLPDIVKELYNPKKLLLQDDLSESKNNSWKIYEQYPNLRKYMTYPSAHHYLSQMLAFQSVSELFDWSEYDLVMKWRYDIVPTNLPNFNDLDFKKFYPCYSQYPTFSTEMYKFTDIGFIMPNDFLNFSKIFDTIMSSEIKYEEISAECFYSSQLKFLGLSDRMIKLSPEIFQAKVYDL